MGCPREGNNSIPERKLREGIGWGYVIFQLLFYYLKKVKKKNFFIKPKQNDFILALTKKKHFAVQKYISYIKKKKGTFLNQKVDSIKNINSKISIIPADDSAML